MDAIGPGDMVVCIGPEPDPWPYWTGPDLVTGAIYQVHDIVPGDHYWDGVPGVELVGWEQTYPPDHEVRIAFSITRFRPISRRTDFETFLNTVKAPRDDVGAPGELVPETA